MEKVTIAKLKDNLSRYLAYVEKGGRVVVYNRRTPVAEIAPVRRGASPDQKPEEDRLRELQRAGIVRVGDGRFPEELSEPPAGESAGVLEALLEERSEGR